MTAGQLVEPRAAEDVRGDYATADCDIQVDITAGTACRSS